MPVNTGTYPVYTGKTRIAGGRDGRGKSSDGQLSVRLTLSQGHLRLYRDDFRHSLTDVRQVNPAPLHRCAGFLFV